MLTVSIPIIIGHPPIPTFTPFAAIRAPTSLPSALTEFLFGSQWMYWLVGIAVGGLLLYVASRRGDRRLARFGIVILSLTVLWVGVALLLVTPQERLRAAHDALLRAAEKRDVKGIVAILAPEFQSTPLHISRPEDRQAALERIFQTYTLRSNRITAYSIKDKSQTASTTVTVLTELENFPMTKTRWALEWVDERGADWQLTAADLLEPTFTIPLFR